MDSLSSFELLKARGTLIPFSNGFVFYGNHSFDLSFISQNFPNNTFIKQVHGHKVLLASKEIQTADGHFTKNSKAPLFIQTADCMPVFLSDGESVFALHVGWRGLSQKILTEACKYMTEPKSFSLWVGPHIQKESFELDQVSAQQLLSPHHISLQGALASKVITPSFDQKNHYHVDLQSILIQEANSLGICKIFPTKVNTYASSEHFSHRRNRCRIGRNYSFIVKT